MHLGEGAVVFTEHEHQEETMRVCEVGRLIQVLYLLLPRLSLSPASTCQGAEC